MPSNNLSSAIPGGSGLPPVPKRHAVLISAAVAAACGPNARVRGITTAGSGSQNAWARRDRSGFSRSMGMPRTNDLKRTLGATAK